MQYSKLIAIFALSATAAAAPTTSTTNPPPSSGSVCNGGDSNHAVCCNSKLSGNILGGVGGLLGLNGVLNDVLSGSGCSGILSGGNCNGGNAYCCAQKGGLLNVVSTCGPLVSL